MAYVAQRYLVACTSVTAYQKTLTPIFNVGFEEIPNSTMRYHFANVMLVVRAVALSFDAELGACLRVASRNESVEPNRIELVS